MEGENALILLLVLVVLLSPFVIFTILEDMKVKSKEKLDGLRFFTKNIIRITKKDAKILLRQCTTLKSSILSVGTDYFMWEEKLPAIGWIENSTGIKPKTLLIANTYNYEEELKVENRNKTSRLLIFNYESERIEDSCYILRHVWASGKLEDLIELIKEVFSQEHFKELVERNQETFLEPSELVEQLEIQAEAAKALGVDDIFIVTEFNAYGTGATKRKVLLKIYPAKYCYQVVSAINCYEIKKKN